MDLKELKEKHPDLVEAITNEATAGMDVKIEKAEEEAAGAEKTRTIGLVTAFFGEEVGEKFKAVVDSGVTVEQYTAICDVQTKDETAGGLGKDKQEILAALENSGPGNPGSGDTTATGGEGGKDFLTLVEEHMAARESTRVEAMQAVMKKNPDAHRAYIASVN